MGWMAAVTYYRWFDSIIVSIPSLKLPNVVALLCCSCSSHHTHSPPPLPPDFPPPARHQWAPTASQPFRLDKPAQYKEQPDAPGGKHARVSVARKCRWVCVPDRLIPHTHAPSPRPTPARMPRLSSTPHTDGRRRGSDRGRRKRTQATPADAMRAPQCVCGDCSTILPAILALIDHRRPPSVRPAP